MAVIASSWHTVVMDGLMAGADRALRRAGADFQIIRVPGSFELPVAASRLAQHFDAIVALGVVIRGGTPHFDYVCSGATQGLMDVAVRTGTPIGFGLLTCDTEAQALERCGLPDSNEDKGFEAAVAAMVTAQTIKGVAHGAR